MTRHHHEPDHLPGEPRPGTGILSLRLALYGMLAWVLLKRGHYGIYHYMSTKHLHRYVNEFSFRHNTAKVGTMNFINMTIDRMVEKRLTYKELING